MRFTPDNPEANALGPGVSEGDVEDAVAVSGYPLQVQVADQLRGEFFVQEEWAFADTETDTIRTIDLLAGLEYWNGREPQPRVRPSLRVLVECKSSGLPYIFFPTSSAPYIPNFPLLAGLGSPDIVVTSDDDPSTWHYSVLDALGLRDDPFLHHPTFATTFSRAERAGAKLRLSGSEPYRALLLPLLKAAEHLARVEAPPPSAYYFDLHAIITVGVLDAPMLVARKDGSTTELELLPWVRVPRHHSASPDRGHHHGIFAVDVIHRAFLDRYISDHLLPFGERLSAKARKHEQVLATGRGFVPEMGRAKWSVIEDRLRPISTSRRLSRARTIAVRIATLGRRP